MVRRLLNRFWQTIAQALQQGMTPRKLAMTCAMGVVIGVFPVYGSTTLLCFAAAFAFRLNVVVIQAVNYLLTPLQLILLIPFMQGGIWLFQLPGVPLDADQLMVRFKADWVGFFGDLGGIVLGGISVWLLLAFPVFLLLTAFLRLVIERFAMGRQNSTR